MYDIVINNLSVNYDLVNALKDINLKIKNKDFLAIIGPNGGGKTTLIKVLLDLLKPNKGSVTKKDNTPIGYVPQFTSFDREFPINVFDTILTGRLPKQIKLFHRYSREDKKSVEVIIEQLGLMELKKRQIGQLSGGQLQKVLLARALVVNPKILVLDEPTTSLDFETKMEIYEILKQLNKDKTIIVVTHDIEEISPYIDSIAYINKTLKFHGEKERYNKVIKNDRIII